jgi:hypothetical protein
MKKGTVLISGVLVLALVLIFGACTSPAGGGVVTGTAKWARTVSAGSSDSVFYSAAVDGHGNVYAAGYQDGTGGYTYGAGVTAAGTASTNVVLVKYNAEGTAQWARTVSEGSSNSFFTSAAV